MNLKGFSKEDVGAMAKEKMKEHKNNIKELEKLLNDWRKMSANCCQNDDWWYEFALGFIKDRIEDEKRLFFKFKRYFDFCSDRPIANNTINIEAIKKDVKCQDIIGQKLSHQTHGRLWYKTPWRNEIQASTVIYLDSNTWWDYGNSEGGSVIDLYMKINQCDFKTAIRHLSTVN